MARQQERGEVEAYSPTNFHIPLNFLGKLRNANQMSGNRKKRTLSSMERFEEAFHK
jgi:2'-5' RNA ligase